MHDLLQRSLDAFQNIRFFPEGGWAAFFSAMCPRGVAPSSVSHLITRSMVAFISCAYLPITALVILVFLRAAARKRDEKRYLHMLMAREQQAKDGQQNNGERYIAIHGFPVEKGKSAVACVKVFLVLANTVFFISWLGCHVCAGNLPSESDRLLSYAPFFLGASAVTTVCYCVICHWWRRMHATNYMLTRICVAMFAAMQAQLPPKTAFQAYCIMLEAIVNCDDLTFLGGMLDQEASGTASGREYVKQFLLRLYSPMKDHAPRTPYDLLSLPDRAIMDAVRETFFAAGRASST